MSYQGTIVSFDEAKRKRDGYDLRASNTARRTARPTEGGRSDASPRSSRSQAQGAHGRRPEDDRGSLGESNGAGRSVRSRSHYAQEGAAPAPHAHKRRAHQAYYPAQERTAANAQPRYSDSYSHTRGTSRRSGASERGAGASRRYEPRRFHEDADRGRYEDEAASESAASRRSASEERKKRRSKQRADKLFDKQFAGATSASADDAGPRAAVYKTEMGREHRHAARMQSSKDQKAAFGFSLTGVLGAAVDKMRSTRKATVFAGALVCLVLVCAFLYTPAQQYYQAVRENARLEAEYDALAQRNAALEADNESLTTDAGVETELRERYNYVKDGEKTANVQGLSEDDSADDDGAFVYGNVNSASISTPETWYSPVLDVVFGYSDSAE